MCAHLRVEAEREHHDEEEHGPEGRKGELGDGKGKDDEGQPRAGRDDLVDALLGEHGQVADVGEDHKAGENGRERIADRDYERVAHRVLRELVVAGERDQAAIGRAHGEEDLHGGVEPHVDVEEAREVGLYVELDALGGALQSPPVNAQYDQHNERKQAREVHNLDKQKENQWVFCFIIVVDLRMDLYDCRKSENIVPFRCL